MYVQVNRKVGYLQGELNKMEYLEHQSQEAAKRVIESKEKPLVEYNKLLEEYNALKKNIEEDTMSALQKIQDKLNYCNMELEKSFKQRFPKSTVSC